MDKFIKIGEGRVVKGKDKLSIIGIGSCLVIVLYDKVNSIGGIAHSMLPSSKEQNSPNPYKYVSTAVIQLVKEMEDSGAQKENINAKLIGAAKIFDNPHFHGPWGIGQRNVIEARKALNELGISVIKEDIGGDYGRSIEFDNATGQVVVTSYRAPPRVL